MTEIEVMDFLQNKSLERKVAELVIIGARKKEYFRVQNYLTVGLTSYMGCVGPAHLVNTWPRWGQCQFILNGTAKSSVKSLVHDINTQQFLLYI